MPKTSYTLKPVSLFFSLLVLFWTFELWIMHSFYFLVVIRKTKAFSQKYPIGFIQMDDSMGKLLGHLNQIT